jgi:predicted NACHT family NTPase
MAKRSLRASKPDGVKRIKDAIRRDGWTQQQLADELNLKGRTAIGKFVNGHPVERWIFEEVCRLLGLEVSEVVMSEETLELQKEKATSDLNPVFYQHLTGVNHYPLSIPSFK